MSKTIEIEGVSIGPGHSVFTIAEIGSNHGQSKETVKKLIDHSVEAGFDAIKFQIYDAEQVFSKDVLTSDVGLDNLYGVKPWWEVARDVILMPRDWFGEMFAYVRSKGKIPLCAIHRVEDAEFLLQYDLPAFKIASIDLNYMRLLEQLVPYEKPFIVSTGMAYLSEIDETMRFLKSHNADVTLLHCVSQYPAKPSEMNLNNLKLFQQAFNVPVGLSDHSTGVVSSVVSVGLGASVVEKHITLDKNSPGPDHPFSIEPPEMHQLIKAIRDAECSLGRAERVLSEKELAARKMVRRSVVASKSIKKGDLLTLDNVKFARPGSGIPANEFKYMINRPVSSEVDAEALLTWEDVE
jgi:N,N'-diacetyllegionaminate synthase